MIYMRGVNMDDLAAMMDFLYRGEANVIQDNLDTFLALANELQLKGLTGDHNGDSLQSPENFFFIFIHSLVSFWRVHKGLRHMLW